MGNRVSQMKNIEENVHHIAVAFNYQVHNMAELLDGLITIKHVIGVFSVNKEYFYSATNPDDCFEICAHYPNAHIYWYDVSKKKFINQQGELRRKTRRISLLQNDCIVQFDSYFTQKVAQEYTTYTQKTLNHL